MVALPGKTVVLGNPPTTAHQIDPLQLADWMAEYEALASTGGISYFDTTLAALNARTGVSDGEYALVSTTEAEAGVYERVSGAWVKVAATPSIYTESLAANQAAESATLAGTHAATAQTARSDAETAEAGAETAQAAAEAAQAAAQSARDTAQAAAAAASVPLFDDTAAGIAGTTDGDSFTAPVGPGVGIYRNDAGTATFVAWLVDPVFDAVADLFANTDAIPQGTVLRAANGFSWEVAATGATDHHTITAGGVKLYALPDTQGDVYTSQLGWPADQDARTEAALFFAGRQTGILGLRQDGSYLLAGPVTIPTTLTSGWRSDDFESLGHGELATRSVLLMNLIDARATANGLSRSDFVTSAPNGFGFGGIRFEHDATIDPATLTNGGNGSSVVDLFAVSNVWASRCRTDFVAGSFLSLFNAPYWTVTDCYLGRQQFCIYLLGRCDYGRMTGTRAVTGYSDQSNIHGDVVKTASWYNYGPRHVELRDNHLISTHRDILDFTGGCFGWRIAGNYMRAAVAALDIKQLSNSGSGPHAAGDEENQEIWFKGLMVTGNTFDGGGVIFTHQISVSNYGGFPDDNRAPHHMHFANNIHVPAPPLSAGYRANGCGNFVVDGDIFLAIEAKTAGDFDASVETELPSNAQRYWPYLVTGSGTVQGLVLTAGTYLWPHVDNPSPTDAADWRGSDSLWLSKCPLETDEAPFSGGTSQGNHDATTGLPGGSGAVSAGDYWSITTAGNIVSGVYMNRFDVIMARRDLADASASDFEDDWVVFAQWAEPVPTDITFKNITWDGRGANQMTLLRGRRLSMHFADAVIARRHAIDLSGSYTELSGNVRILRDPTAVTDQITPIRIQGLGPYAFDLNLTNQSPLGNDGVIEVQGVCYEISIDGEYNGPPFVCEVNSGNSVDRINLGMRTGLTVRGAWETVTGTGTVGIAQKGAIHLDRSNAVVTSHAGTGGLATLAQGEGAALTIGSGVIRVAHVAHIIDTEGAAASDTLSTIAGGRPNDLLMLSIADAARTVTVTNTDNIALASDRLLDATTEALVLRKFPDGNWREVAFTG